MDGGRAHPLIPLWIWPDWCNPVGFLFSLKRIPMDRIISGLSPEGCGVWACHHGIPRQGSSAAAGPTAAIFHARAWRISCRRTTSGPGIIYPWPVCKMQGGWSFCGSRDPPRKVSCSLRFVFVLASDWFSLVWQVMRCNHGLSDLGQGLAWPSGTLVSSLTVCFGLWTPWCSRFRLQKVPLLRSLMIAWLSCSHAGIWSVVAAPSDLTTYGLHRPWCRLLLLKRHWKWLGSGAKSSPSYIILIKPSLSPQLDSEP